MSISGVFRASILRLGAIIFSSGVILLSAGTASGVTSEFRCSHIATTIKHDGERNTAWVCEGAAAAIGFLKFIGVSQKSPVVIIIVDVFPVGLQGTVGYYDWVDDSVFLLGSATFLNDTDVPQAFKVQNDKGIYESYVAHEVAHAIAAHNFAFEQPSAASQEYIAGVVQLSILESHQRAQILDRFSGDGFDEVMEINSLSYQLNPARFAIEAYRHYQKPGNGASFIEKVLAGTVWLRDQPAY